jgi:hypothetical protein
MGIHYLPVAVFNGSVPSGRTFSFLHSFLEVPFGMRRNKNSLKFNLSDV